MAIKCISRKMSDGHSHEHIIELGWENDQTKVKGVSTRQAMVDFIEKNGTQAVYCPERYGGKSAWVHVARHGGIRFVQTYADGSWTNNLLALPLH